MDSCGVTQRGMKILSRMGIVASVSSLRRLMMKPLENKESCSKRPRLFILIMDNLDWFLPRDHQNLGRQYRYLHCTSIAYKEVELPGFSMEEKAGGESNETLLMGTAGRGISLENVETDRDRWTEVETDRDGSTTLETDRDRLTGLETDNEKHIFSSKPNETETLRREKNQIHGEVIKSLEKNIYEKPNPPKEAYDLHHKPRQAHLHRVLDKDPNKRKDLVECLKQAYKDLGIREQDRVVLCCDNKMFMSFLKIKRKGKLPRWVHLLFQGEWHMLNLCGLRIIYKLYWDSFLEAFSKQLVVSFNFSSIFFCFFFFFLNKS